MKSNRQSALTTKGHSRNFRANGALTALPLRSVNKTDNAVYGCGVKAERDYLIAAKSSSDVCLEHRIELVVRREGILINLTGAQFC